MRHLVTGAAGFIGSHLCEQLIKDGHEIVGLDNLITGRLENVKHLLAERTFTLQECDVTSPLAVRGKFDHVWHLASLASPVFYQRYPIETLMVGSLGTRNMLELAKRDGARFLLTSTSECYGDPAEHPQKETYFGNVNPVGIRSCYDESKRFAEALTMVHARAGLRTNIARIFNTYGPRMALNDGRVVPAFVNQALNGLPLTLHGDGEQTRSFCYVADLVDGLIRLSTSEERFPVNLGNPQEIKIREFGQFICDLTGAEFKIDPIEIGENDPKRRCPDISKAKRILDWEPKWSLRDGLRETVAYFKGKMPPSANNVLNI